MNLEELKSEANKLGYRLVKKSPYIPFPTCSCRKGKGIERFQCFEGYYYKCPVCGKESKPTKLMGQAAINWNNGIWR